MTKEEVKKSIKELEQRLSIPNKYIPFPVNTSLENRLMLLKKREIELSISDGSLNEDSSKFPLSVINESIEHFQITIEKAIKNQEKDKLIAPNVKWEHPLIAFTKLGIENLNKLLKNGKYESDFELIKNAKQLCETELELFIKEYGNK